MNAQNATPTTDRRSRRGDTRIARSPSMNKAVKMDSGIVSTDKKEIRLVTRKCDGAIPNLATIYRRNNASSETIVKHYTIYNGSDLGELQIKAPDPLNSLHAELKAPLPAGAWTPGARRAGEPEFQVSRLTDPARAGPPAGRASECMVGSFCRRIPWTNEKSQGSGKLQKKAPEADGQKQARRFQFRHARPRARAGD